jgi:hypothetical protein
MPIPDAVERKESAGEARPLFTSEGITEAAAAARRVGGGGIALRERELAVGRDILEAVEESLIPGTVV